MNTNLQQYKKRCETMNDGKSVFIPDIDPKNGRGKIEIMFINERPGPKTNETKYVSYDNPDPSAKLFKEVFQLSFGEDFRKHIYITNAIIWVPAEDPRNHPPTRKQLRAVENLNILKDQIEKIRPRIIVPLGNSALYSLKKIYPDSGCLRKYRLKHGRKLIADTPILIFPIYHTAAQARRTRTEKQQVEDWRKMKSRVDD